MTQSLPRSIRGLRWLAALVLTAGLASAALAQQGSKGSGEHAQGGDGGEASGASEEQAEGETQQDTGNASYLSDLPIVRERLDNGLRVVMSPSRTVPTVAVAVYYDVGSRNEVQGRSGFAHLFEHMMFQGSRNVGKMEHFQLIMNRGGRVNGTTNSDRTNYFETLPSNELELGLWLEADRMRSLAVNAENFDNQVKTVKEERRQRYDNQPYMQSMIRINELAYGDYWPYAHPTIGSMQDLSNAPLEAVQEFFDTYYAPNNAVLGIAGDFDPNEAMELVEEHFGDIPKSDIPDYEPPERGPQTAERTESMLDEQAELPAFHVAYHIPKSREPDHYPLELLAIVLGDGKSSRLYQKLVKEEELLQEIHVSTDDRRGPDLFSFWAIVAGGNEADTAREIIFAELEEVAENGITEDELEKAKNRMRSEFLFGLQSNLQRAMTLSAFELYWGDAKLLRDELDRYLDVEIEDVQRVAGRYFDPTGRTVLDVVPAEEGAGEESQ